MPRSGQFFIRELAEEFGVTLRTLRFYESRGLLAPRRVGHDRLYSNLDRAKLKVILQGKKLGFTLLEIQDFIRLKDYTGRKIDEFISVGDLRLTKNKLDEQLSLLRSQRADIDQAIADIEQVISG